MKKQTLALIVIVIFSSFLLLTVSQKPKQPVVNTNNLNLNNQLNVIDKHFCQTEADCVLTGNDPEGFATCTNRKWAEKWSSNPLSRNHVWLCALSEEEAEKMKCGCVNNKCQRINAEGAGKECGAQSTPLSEGVWLKITNGPFTQEQDIIFEVNNNLDKEIGFDPSSVDPFSSLSFNRVITDKDGYVQNIPYGRGIEEGERHLFCPAPTDIPPDYDKTRNWPVILKPKESYKIIWPQKLIKGCLSTNPMFEEGTYLMTLKYCYPKTDECFETRSNEFSVVSTDFFTDNQTTPTQKEISLTSDKTQYQSINEEIKITLKNNLTESIFTLPDWAIQEKLPDSSWFTIYSSFGITVAPLHFGDQVIPSLPQDYQKVDAGKTYELIWKSESVIGLGIYRAQLKYLHLTPEKIKRYDYPRNSHITVPEQDLTIIYSNEFAILSSQQTGEKCRNYERNGISEMYCAVCDDGICEPYEKCVASYCSGGVCTEDCGPLYCQQDCATNKEITLKVDKDDYLQGKDVKITLTNNSDKIIWISQTCGLPWWDLEKSISNKWEKVEIMACVKCEMTPLPIKILPSLSVQGFVAPPPTQTQKNEILEDVWNTNIGCDYPDEKMRKYAETGTYKLAVDYYYDCLENVTKYSDYQDLSKICKGKKVVYSDKFGIIGPLY